MATFRVPTATAAKSESPALLFRDLRRDPAIKFLWDHQAKLLEEYNKRHLKTSDLAIELPTGSGKTLVALLIAEHRRRAFKERVAFLCPTRQLCNQVAAQTKKYGLKASLLTGSRKKYDPVAFLEYQQAKAIAVTTYSGVFNVNPGVDDAQLLICDDAHAADNYVSSLWTVSITRDDDPETFLALYRTLKDVLPDNVVHWCEGYESKDDARSSVDLISPIATFARQDQIRDVLNEFSEDGDWRFSWSQIEAHLDACSIYASADRFEIRPVIAPTETHTPFSGAKQRIYMSATLGEDGDIERCFGVRKIARLPIPEGWDKRGTGRRLVLFPGFGQDDDVAWLTATKIFDLVPRSLVLVPDDRTKKKVNKLLSSKFPLVGADEIEKSMDAFTNHQDKRVLVIANRWEGIDLPGEDCRVVALSGLPSGAGLQERYMMERLGAVSQLRDRLRTRVTQAMGRCTRDEADFSIVLMLGSDLLKWCCTQANLAAVHPELQAEIAFGLDNSEGRSDADFLELAQLFLDQSEEWSGADSAIIESRNALTKEVDSFATTLASVAPHEIDFVYRLWNAEYDVAHSTASKVNQGLEGGSELKPYRSFWHHQAALAAYLAYEAKLGGNYKALAIKHLEEASTTSLGIRWLGKLRAKLIGAGLEESTEQLPVQSWFGELNSLLTDWGIRGGAFARNLAALDKDLQSTRDSKALERGLRTLGRILGAKTHQWKEDGAPDGLWVFGDWHAFVFEAKDEKAPSIPLKTVRQAATHEERARADKLIPPSVRCTTVVVSRQGEIDRVAALHAREMAYVSPETLITLARRAAEALTSVRTHAPTLALESLQEEACASYEKMGVSMISIKAELEKVLLRDLPQR